MTRFFTEIMLTSPGYGIGV